MLICFKAYCLHCFNLGLRVCWIVVVVDGFFLYFPLKVSQLGAVVHKYQAASQNASSGLSTQDLQNTCSS